MSSSAFDVSTFLDATTTDALTKRENIPAGTVVTATIGEPTIRPWQGKKDPSKSGIAADFPFEIDLTAAPDLRSKIGQDKITIKYGIMLDTTDAGLIDWGKGKNGKLRQLREATDQNVPGQSFSLRGLQGRQVKALIRHRENEGELYEEIEKVAHV